MSNSLEIMAVSKAFGDKLAVDNLSAQIPAGSIYGFLGPNGAGKTTTIRMIMNILYPDTGGIRLFGDQHPDQCKNRTGYLPEEKGLYKKMQTAELIAYFGQLKGLSRTVAKTRALALLKKFGLSDYATKKCDLLSKGMGQKIQIIATILHEPELVVLDEPFSGLDPVNVELIREVILDLKRAGKTVIFSTHAMEQAEQICDFIMLINAGKKMLDGPLGSIKKHASQTIKIDYHGDSTLLQNLPGVTRINDMGHVAELSLIANANTQRILSLLVQRLEIRSFSIAQPSLHEIFIRTISPDSPEPTTPHTTPPKTTSFQTMSSQTMSSQTMSSQTISPQTSAPKTLDAQPGAKPGAQAE
ncbi:MAG: ATP-binding cassette domain-containing protein [Pseudomonadales bacterium]|nr:ATP-binding cassette domain-containing protein [Pseudomonadales bacterium]